LKKLIQVKALGLMCILFLTVTVSTPANGADTKIFQVMSDTDLSNPSSLDWNYDLQRIEVGIFSSNTDRLNIWLHFRNPITNSMFLSSANGGKKPWALVSIWRQNPSTLGGNGQDYRIFTNSSTPYPNNNNSITAGAEGNTSSGGTRSSLSKCNPYTWSNISDGVQWVGFSISLSCSGIPRKFYVTGYAEPDTTNGSAFDYDYSPDTALFIDLDSATNVTGATASPKPISRMAQSITFEKPENVTTDLDYAEIFAFSTSGLPIRFESRTTSTCQYSYTEGSYAYFMILRAGLCIVTANQDGNDYYLPADTIYETFMIEVPSKPTAKATPKPTKKATPTPTPTKKIVGTASTTNKSNTSSTSSSSTKIGGTATTQKAPTPASTKKK
jgi:hypothetical protein